MTFHRGGKDGHVIATATRCHQVRGDTDIHFTEPVDEIQLTRRQRILRLGTPKTHFTVEIREKPGEGVPPSRRLQFVWDGHTELWPHVNATFSRPRIHPIATFRPSRLEGLAHSIGYIDMNWDPESYYGYDESIGNYKRFELQEGYMKRLLDVIIISALVMQERDEEHRIIVMLLSQLSLI